MFELDLSLVRSKFPYLQVRDELSKAEEAEEEELVAQGKTIMERKKKRRKVEEATQKLLEMESKFSKIDAKLVESKDLVDWQNREEVRELAEQRKILMELLSKHQVALLKASQMVTETKTKLDSHMQSEKMLVDPIKEKITKHEKELEPVLALEEQINRKYDFLYVNSATTFTYIFMYIFFHTFIKLLTCYLIFSAFNLLILTSDELFDNVGCKFRF